MAVPPREKLPGWPVMMKRDLAAAYCDMSIPSFEREIVAGRLPSGVMFGGREHWYRDALDRAIAALVGGGGVDDIAAQLRKRYGKAA